PARPDLADRWCPCRALLVISRAAGGELILEAQEIEEIVGAGLVTVGVGLACRKGVLEAQELEEIERAGFVAVGVTGGFFDHKLRTERGVAGVFAAMEVAVARGASGDLRLEADHEAVVGSAIRNRAHERGDIELDPVTNAAAAHIATGITRRSPAPGGRIPRHARLVPRVEKCEGVVAQAAGGGLRPMLVHAQGGRADLRAGTESAEIELDEEARETEGPEVALARCDLGALAEVGSGGRALDVGVLRRQQGLLARGETGKREGGKGGSCSGHVSLLHRCSRSWYRKTQCIGR